MVAGAVLIQGELERSAVPPADRSAPAPDVIRAERARVVVRADLDKTPLTYFADYWAQLAERAHAHLTSVGSARTPAIVVGTRLVLTTAEPALELLVAERRARLTDDAAADGELPLLGSFRLRGWNPDIGLALFDVTGPELAPFTLTDPRVMPPGSYVGTVTLTAEGEPAVAPGYFVAVTEENDAPAGDLVVSMSMPETPALAAVVDLDGALLGVAYHTSAGQRVISTTNMLRLIERLQMEMEKVCRALEAADLDDAVRERFVIERGVLIEYVHTAAFLPEPSLRGGDILLEWGEEDVTSAERFRQLYDARKPGDLVRYRVLRNGRRIAGGTVVPDAECRPAGQDPVRFASSGMAFEWVRPALNAAGGEGYWVVTAVRPGSPAAGAGVEERDRLVSIDGATMDAQDDRPALEAAAERTEPMLVSLRRGVRMKLMVVEPSDPPDAPADVESER